MGRVRDASGVYELNRVAVVDGKQVYSSGLQYPLYPLLRADTAAFRDVAASSFITSQSLGTGEQAEQVYTVLASSNYFRLLGTDPSLGRFFGPGEEGEVAPGISAPEPARPTCHLPAELALAVDSGDVGARQRALPGATPQATATPSR